MEVTGLGWLGTSTPHAGAPADFDTRVLGLTPVGEQDGCWVFALGDDRHVEIFGPGFAGREHFTTVPVVGVAVRDSPAAVAQLVDGGVELTGSPGPTWQHFRGSDGTIYELTATIDG